MDTNQIVSNFSSGELSPVMLGRVDLKDKYLSASKLLQNYVVLPQGGLLKRPGTRFLAELDSTKTYAILSYTPSATTSYLLVFSENSLSIYKAEDVIDAFKDYFTTLSEPIQTFVSPYTSSELQELNWAPVTTDDDSRVVLFVQGSHPPYELVFMENEESPFTFKAVVFTSPPFKALDSANTVLTVSDEQWVAKITSSDASEFSALGSATYVEWQKDDVWVLAKVLTTTTTPAAPSDPSGAVCYVQPIQNIITDVASSARFVALDNTYDTEEIPSGSLHIRSDTLVFNYSCEDAYLRVKSEYEKIRTTASTSSAYALSGSKFGSTLWVKVTSYLGPRDYPVEFISSPVASELVVGDTYKILRATVDMDVYAPIDNSTIKWEDSFKYNTVGDTFSLQNKFRVVTGTGELANLSKAKTFDVVETTTELPYHSCTGNITIADDLSTLGHTATLRASRSFFAFGSSYGVEVGQYLLVKHGEKVWMLYKVGTIVSATQATVIIVDGTLPRKTSSSEIVNEGRSSTFRVSEWSAGNYPRAVSWVERRLVFAGCKSAPESVWLSRVSDTYDFRTVDANGASTDDAGITYPLAGKSMNKIVNLTAGPTLAIGTQSAIWQMRKSYDGEAITPTSVTFTEETADGVYGKSLRIGSAVICVDLSRKHLIELSYSYEINGLEGQNLNLLSGHLFEQDRIVDFCFQQRPYGIIWVNTESGAWYSMTYNKKQGMYSWSRHTTFGRILGMTLLQNASDLSGYDRVVLLTSRNGHTFLELLEDFYTKDVSASNKNYNFLDCTRRLTPPFTDLPPYGADTNPPSDPLPDPKYPVDSPDFSKVYGYWEDAKSIISNVKGSATLAYQWQRSSDNVNYSDVSGSVASYFPLPSLSPADDGYYRCIASNGLGSKTTVEATVQCVVHPFSESWFNDLHYMGFYDRYDQREDYHCLGNGLYIGYADNQTPYYRDNVFAWAKGVTIYGSTGYHGYAYYYVGAYGASNCRLVLENSTIYLHGFYINAFDYETRNSNNNSVEIINSTVLHDIGETIIGGYGMDNAEENTATLTLSAGTVWKNGFNHVVMCADASVVLTNCHFTLTDSGTSFLGDYGNEGSRYSQPILVLMTTGCSGNSIDLLNNSMIRVGQGQGDGQQAHQAIGIYYGTTSTQLAFRFGGGFLAYYGDCTHPEIDHTMHWSLKSEQDNCQILPTSVIQVRNSDGTWRAGVEGDFTVTYCATDAEGLAATNNLYSGLAGYTVITAGASI